MSYITDVQLNNSIKQSHWPGREADHSLPTIAEVKNALSSSIRVRGVVLS
jgi:hypothetical protein